MTLPTADNVVKTDPPSTARRPGVWLKSGYSLTVREIAASAGISYWTAYRASRAGLFGKGTNVGTSLYFDAQVVPAVLVDLVPQSGATS
jgi:hypothetical protein